MVKIQTLNVTTLLLNGQPLSISSNVTLTATPGQIDLVYTNSTNLVVGLAAYGTPSTCAWANTVTDQFGRSTCTSNTPPVASLGVVSPLYIAGGTTQNPILGLLRNVTVNGTNGYFSGDLYVTGNIYTGVDDASPRSTRKWTTIGVLLLAIAFVVLYVGGCKVLPTKMKELAKVSVGAASATGNGIFKGALAVGSASIGDDGNIAWSGALSGRADAAGISPANNDVARTIQTKFGESISVKDFGAVGDGVVDDTNAIQSALSSGIQNLYFPAGTYMVSALSCSTAGVRLRGDGRASVLQRIAGTPPNVANIISMTASLVNPIISDMCFVNINNAAGGSSLSTDNCIYFAPGVSDGVVERCFFNTGFGSAVFIDSGVRCRVDSNLVYAMGDSVTAPTYGVARGAFVLWDSCSYSNVSGNIINEAKVGVMFHAYTSGAIQIHNTASNNIIRNCCIYGISIYDNNINNGGPGYIRHFVVDGNNIDTIYGNIRNGFNNLFNYGAGIYLQGAQETSVAGNTVSDTNIATEHGLLVPSAIASVNCTGFAITGNKILNPYWYGIGVTDYLRFNTTGCGTISGNSIECNSSTQFGITVFASIDVSVTSNYIKNFTQYGIRVWGSAVSNERVSVCTNTLYAPTSASRVTGIQIDRLTDGLVAGNMLVAEDRANGTAIDIGQTTCTRVSVLANQVRLFAAGINVRSTAVDTVVQGNNVSSNPAPYTFSETGWSAATQTNSGTAFGGTELYGGAWAPVSVRAVNGSNQLDIRGATLVRMTGSPTIVRLIMGLPGQILTIYNGGTGSITINHVAGVLLLAGSTNMTLTAGSSISFICLATVLAGVNGPCKEISRSIA